MFRKFLSLFLAIGIFVIGSGCIHTISELSSIPVAHGMNMVGDENCHGETVGMTCCSDAHSNNPTIVTSAQVQKLLLPVFSPRCFTFCECYFNFQNQQGRFRAFQTLYHSPPGLTGVVILKE